MDLERMGLYITRKLQSRSSVELPRVLQSSKFRTSKSEKSISKKIMKNLRIKNNEINEEELPGDTEIFLDALSKAEDSRHKLYKMTYFPEAALSLLGQRFAGMYASHFRILSEIKKRKPDFIPRVIMEYSAGFGPATLAARMIWGNEFTDALAVESSENLSQIGQYLTQEMPYIRWQYNIYEETQKFDLIILNYSMFDLSNNESRLSLVRNLWNRLRNGGVLVAVESGTPTGFRLIFNIRELFISELDQMKYHFIAPCPHESFCPLAITGKDWCHFSQRIQQIPKHIYRKSRDRKSKNFDDEKFSYIVIGKGEGPRDIYKTEKRAPTVELKSYFWPRIVLPIIKRGKHALIDVCSAPHSFERLVVTKNSPNDAGYKIARNALWGDLWRYPKRYSRPDARDYTPDDVKKHLHNLNQKVHKIQQYEHDTQKDIKDKFVTQSQKHFGA